MSVLERFLRYTACYTTSDEHSCASPSTERQKTLGHLLMGELKELGLRDILMDGAGNVTATLPSTCKGQAPVLGLISHMDTSPDACGEGVKPRVLRYEGGDLPLNGQIALTEALCPGLSAHKGEELVVTDGTTLLGADDKAGIAEIMEALERLSTHSHGEVRVVFTTDEEIGRGIEGLDVAGLGCAYAYTVDGGPIGEIEYENFNAASAVVSVSGIGVHPGSAKGVMKNASGIAMELHAMLPADEVPEKTEGYQGFYHLHHMEGGVTGARLEYLIRDHSFEKFEEKKNRLSTCCEAINAKYGEGTACVRITDSYYNMKEKILPHMELIRKAEEAFRANGVEPSCVPIRGGTDGAMLSWQGLPCPNLSTGGYNFHSVREWIPVKSLETMADVLVKLVDSFSEG